MVGKLNEEQINCLESNNIEYQSLEGLSDTQIDQCYATTDLVCFISQFEGFGVPILEANRSGCPIICSVIPVLHEVGAEAVAYVNPNDIDEMHNSIEHLLNSPEERKRLVLAGLKNVEKFTPEIIRNQWLDMYKDL